MFGESGDLQNRRHAVRLRRRSLSPVSQLLLQLLDGLGEDLEVVVLTVHGQDEGLGDVYLSLVQGVTDVLGVHAADLFGLAHHDAAQVLQAGVDLPRDLEVVHAVDILGAGHLLEYLGHLGVPLLQGLVGIGVVLELGHRLGDNGVPEVALRLAEGSFFLYHPVSS